MASIQFSQDHLKQIKVYDDKEGWSLDLSRSNLIRLPPAVCSMEDLQTLDLSDNPQLNSLPKEFYRLHKLKNVLLAHCSFKSFPEHLQDIPTLESLRLSLNNIVDFPITLVEMGNLHSLELVMCSLYDVPGCVTTLPSLKHLDMRCNKLTENSFSVDFRYMRSLSELDISNNDLQRLPDIICKIPTLRVLRVCHNNLTTLPPSIEFMKKLRELRLSNNRISTLPDQLYNLEQLKVLHLDSNHLSVLSPHINRLAKLKDNTDSFTVDNNPMTRPPVDICTQGLQAMINFFQEAMPRNFIK